MSTFAIGVTTKCSLLAFSCVGLCTILVSLERCGIICSCLYISIVFLLIATMSSHLHQVVIILMVILMIVVVVVITVVLSEMVIWTSPLKPPIVLCRLLSLISFFLAGLVEFS